MSNAEIIASGRPPPETALSRVTRPIALVGGLVVVAIAALVTTSVVLRWTTSQGVNGDFELVQIALAFAVFSFLPLCQAKRGNVMVDTFTLKAPAVVQRGLDALWDLLYAGFAGFIAWRLVLGGLESRSSGTNTMVLALPTWPVILACAALMALLAGVAVATAVARWRDRP